MKKILSILMILVLVGGVAFAQAEPSFKGSATLSWGMDLGSGIKGDSAKVSHGFLNEASASVTLPFVKGGKTFGEGDVYAFLDLSGVSLGLAADMKGAKATGRVGAVSAKVVFYGAYVTLYNAPNMTTDYATRIVNDDNYKPFKTGFTGYGTKIGYAKKDMMDLDVGIKFVSNGSWKDRDVKDLPHLVKEVIGSWNPDYGIYIFVLPDTDHEFKLPGNLSLTADVAALSPTIYYSASINKLELWTKGDAKKANSKYGFGLDFHMVPVEKYLTVDANFNMTFDPAQDYRTGVKSSWGKDAVMNFGVNLMSSPIEGLNLNLGFDGGSSYEYKNKDGDKSGVFAWALGFGADYTHKMVGTVDFGMYVASKATPYGKGTVVKLDPKEENGMDMAMTLGYKGLPIVENLDIHARVNVFRLLSKISKDDKKQGHTIPLGLNVGAAYTAKISDSMSVRPYADVWGETNRNQYADDTKPEDRKARFGLAYKLGVEFMPMEHLTIDASWMHGELGADDNLGAAYIDKFGDAQGKVTPFQNKANNGKFVLSATINY